MTAPFSPNHLSTKIRHTIGAELDKLEAAHDIRILLAVESGSRAWGFASPDSDYDARFVYVHKAPWYVQIHAGRDVVELPITGDLDINGWELRKALRLLLKPNPVLLEWLSSPLIYRQDQTICDRLRDLAQQVAHGPACLHHYRRLGLRQYTTYVEGRERVNLKKYFYVLRPAMAIRFIRHNPDLLPPMRFDDLLEGVQLDADLTAQIADLKAAKIAAAELGDAAPMLELNAFATAEFEWVETSGDPLITTSPTPTAQAKALDSANTLLRDLVLQ